jgi:hypothetical protein
LTCPNLNPEQNRKQLQIDDLFEKVEKIMNTGLQIENIDLAVQYVESLKLKEETIRIKRQSLETMIYNNIHLVIENAQLKCYVRTHASTRKDG